MKNKKIIIVTKYFYPLAAGIETSILETYSLLAKKGWDVSVHTTINSFTKNEKLPKTGSYKGLKIIRHKPLNFMFLPSYWSDATVLSIHNFNIMPQFYILFKVYLDKILDRKKYLVVLTPHGGFTPEWKMFNPVKGAIKKIIQFSVGKSLINKSVDLVRAVSTWEKKGMQKEGIAKDMLITISNGLEPEALMNLKKLASKKIKEKTKKFKKYFIQVGRISRIKNLETPIKAMTNLPSDINFVILGPIQDSRYKDYLFKLIKKLNLEKKIFFVPTIRGIDKYYLIKNALFMVQMSHLESFCNVVLEGMSQGLVCLVSNKGALPSLVKNNINGYVIDVNDYKTLSKKMNFVLKNKNASIIKNIEKKNRNFASYNTWSRIADNLNNLYINNI